MEMTRRKFIQNILNAGLAVVVGLCWLAKKASPRRFVRAARLKKYPGSVKTLPDTHNQGKWSG